MSFLAIFSSNKTASASPRKEEERGRLSRAGRAVVEKRKEKTERKKDSSLSTQYSLPHPLKIAMHHALSDPTVRVLQARSERNSKAKRIVNLELVKSLQTFPLQCVDFSNSEISDDWFSEIGKIRGCKELILRGCKKLTGACIQVPDGLETLDLRDCKNLEGDYLPLLIHTESLKRIDIRGCPKVKEEQVNMLRDTRSDWKVISDFDVMKEIISQITKLSLQEV